MVAEGRGVISNQVTRNQQLIAVNCKSISSSLADLEAQAKQALKENLDSIHEEFDCSAALLSVLEQVALADSEIANMLCEASTVSNSNSGTSANINAGAGAKKSSKDNKGREKEAKRGDKKDGNAGGTSELDDLMNSNSAASASVHRRVLFQAISNNTADFQMMSSLINPFVNPEVTMGNKKKPVGRNANSNTTTTNNPQQDGEYKSIRGDLDRLEVARLYKLALNPSIGYSISSFLQNPDLVKSSTNPWSQQGDGSGVGRAFENTLYERMYTLLTPEQLNLVLKRGWDTLDFSPVFCSDAGKWGDDNGYFYIT